MTVDEQRLRAELPEFLELLGDVAGWVGGLDLAKAREVPAEVLSGLRDGLLRSLEYLHELFALRGEPSPYPEPGIAYGALGPSLKRTLPQRLAAQLADELNGIPGNRLEDVSQFAALGLHARVTDLLRFVGFLEEERAANARAAAPPTVVSTRRAKAADAKTGSHARRSAAAAPAAPKPTAKPAAEPATPKHVAKATEEPVAPKPAPQAVAPAAAPAAARPRAAAPAPSPAAPAGGAGPDLSSYDIRIDEAGERIDADGASVWFAAGAGPRAAGEGLAASFAVAFPGGVAFATADGAESSLGARLASAVAVRTFCRAAAVSPAAPEAAVRTAQGHLDMLLSSLLASGDASVALTKVRGSVAVANARRILAHTRQPDEELRRVPPALAASLVGGVAVSRREGLRVSVVRLGPGLAELRNAGRVSTLLGASRPPTSSFLGPGARAGDELARLESAATITLAPGDALLLGTSALSKASTSAWTALAELWPPFPEGLSTGETARDLLRRAERWGAAEPPHFGGPLAFALLLAR